MGFAIAFRYKYVIHELISQSSLGISGTDKKKTLTKDISDNPK